MKAIRVYKSELSELVWQKLAKEYDLPPDSIGVYIAVCEPIPNPEFSWGPI